jgi:hypothetical protein
MTISLTCACGARLEIDETFAGQTINCPDCQRPIKAPRPERPGLRTSGFALTSLILALLGAFTIVGTLLAVVFGALALRDIARRPDEVTGKGFAAAGIALGLLLTAVTGFALTSAELFGLWTRFQWAGKLDYPEGEEVVRRVERFRINRPRPAAKWGIKRSERGERIEDQHSPGDLLMVNLDEDAHLLCYTETCDGEELRRCLEKVREEFRKRDRAGIFSGGKPTEREGVLTIFKKAERSNPVGKEIMEEVVDKRLGGRTRRFIIRVVKPAGDPTAYVLIGGAPLDRFPRVEAAIKASMDSLRVLDHDRPDP